MHVVDGSKMLSNHNRLGAIQYESQAHHNLVDQLDQSCGLMKAIFPWNCHLCL